MPIILGEVGVESVSLTIVMRRLTEEINFTQSLSKIVLHCGKGQAPKLSILVLYMSFLLKYNRKIVLDIS